MFTHVYSSPAVSGISLALSDGEATTMFRITEEPGTDEVRVRLEGDLTGTGVQVLEDFWSTTGSSYASGRVLFDLSGVCRVDDAGRFLLALIHQTGVRMCAAGVEMRALVRSIDQDWPMCHLDGPGWRAVGSPGKPQR
jgi:ABC-type transporter Mla MlaB component